MRVGAYERGAKLRKTVRQAVDAGDISTLRQSLARGSRSERLMVVGSLGAMSQPNVESLLMDALADSSWLVRETALELLAKRNPDRDPGPVLAKLRGAAGPSKDSLSVEDMLSLGVWRLRQLDLVPKLIQLVEEESDEAMAAAIALGELGDSRATLCLLAALESPKSGLRASSAEALGKIGDEGSIAGLVRHLDDERKIVRDESALALLKLDPEGRQALQEVADGGTGRAQRAARKGLRKAAH